MFRKIRSVSALSASLLAVLLLAAEPRALAHEDHDHAEEPAAAAMLPTDGGSRAVVELTSELYEALIQSHGDHLDIYLDRFETNEPVPGATLSLSVDDTAAGAAVEESPGLYRVDITPLPPGSAVALTLVVSAPLGDDLLGGTLEIPVSNADAAGEQWPGAASAVWWVLGALLLGGLTWLVRRALHARRTPSAMRPGAVAVITAAALVALSSTTTPAHEGHDHAEEEAPAAVAVGDGSRPARLADGSLFVPKATQRILELRTQRAAAGSQPVVVRLAGEVVGDPRASAALQTLQGGRVAGIASDWPVLGARVKRGQPLLRLTPSGSGGERASTAAEAARVAAELVQARAELARLEGLPGVVSRAEVDAARSTVRSLVAQRAALQGSAGGGELLSAPLDGVIASIETSPGVIAAPGETLLTIIDPARLSVEALAFQSVAGSEITAASVALPNGKSLAARLVGIGTQLQGGAVPVRLDLADVAPGLNVGTPVVVFLERALTAPGLAVPVESLVRTPQGDRIVYEKIAAERFMPRTVRVRPISAGRIAVLAGLEADARVVTGGAALLTQIR
ncbi:MAG TPA: HlyD family efflux transporter periplasmic adaptor subunit [Steroidobacteraceae bacterium]|nr:HlyD family efflux transporter periplasmic adaptor subunit [Steroidobacteraceae bacterium]HRX88066.1 HlyD family efflux transporter periplasmic adaptor subunit [Steroidobacteraceae bacterium]